MIEKAVHRALLRPDAYPEETGRIEYRETHVSRLYFTDQHVYKVKKAVDLGFLNFTTLDRRRFYCHEEIRLNRRFCPDTYLDVVEIRGSGHIYRVGGSGNIVDFAVKMRRLPEARMLVHLLKLSDPSLPGEMQRVGRRIAALHGESEIVCSSPGGMDLDSIRGNWLENFRQTAPFVDRLIEASGLAACAAYVERFLEAHAFLFKQRQEQGFVRDGHGDMHAEHICLTEPVRIYDCIEFNRRFRVADVVADLAFLLMDLDFRDRRDLSAIVLESYTDSAAIDCEMPLLLPFYKIYRAWVRGKVASLLSRDPEALPATRSAASEEAKRYFNLALGYLCPPALVITCGLMGTGKTTLGRALAKALGGSLLRSDELRKELAGIPASTSRLEPFGAGIYSPAMTDKTYELLLSRSESTLAEGRSVIVDASFLRPTERELFIALAKKRGTPFMIVLTECPIETALERLDNRQRLGGDASDGRRELLESQTTAFVPPDETQGIIRIDTTQSIDYNVQLVLCEILERFGPDERA